ncbi:hypothetical protein COV06_00180 [Candidatus Uhrbacteria bacterium CG10_big_fil_rev_8_21_14_0_10_50_16]|uniref:SHS2 domain-containing protein n=1 Tax=Candidatus Uhrbacteria bacterium CG10_big_fil_rev_8_21_14_0_10_50_16 TaxID=1975039 RepID=A0A2H0RMM9_9BACT|nr:MAG: hypothetical protein COV06_00180 [Candidatus Uhrbacteria bacterium CG10_big_fil_rev_8_21_14_0_10_50_16]
MSLFAKKEERFVGIDIGAGGIKLVELLYEHGAYKLMTYGSTSRMADVVDTALTDVPKEAVDHIKELIKQAGVESTHVIASLPVHSVFSSIIAIPDVKNPVETRALVERQAGKLMPLPVDQMVIDFQILDRVGRENTSILDADVAASKQAKITTSSIADKNVRVLITGAEKKMVQTYTQIFQDAGLDLASLETEPFALIRSLIGNDKSPIMVLDVGAFRTNMTIVEEGIPFLNRSIKVGGAMVTREIAKQMGIAVEEAEQMKQDLHTENGDVPKAVVDLFQPIVNEISYAMELFAKSKLSDKDRVEKVILTGGSALLLGLDTFLTEKLNVRTFVGDPWARVQINEAMRPMLEEIGPRFSVALGLAMHAAKGAPVEVKKDSKSKKQ